MLAIVMGLETWRLGGEASLDRIFTSSESFSCRYFELYDVVWFELLETFRFQDKDNYEGEVFSILSSA